MTDILLINHESYFIIKKITKEIESNFRQHKRKSIC